MKNVKTLMPKIINSKIKKANFSSKALDNLMAKCSNWSPVMAVKFTFTTRLPNAL